MIQITTVNPSIEEQISNYDHMSKEMVSRLLEKTKREFPEWKDFEKRLDYIYNLVQFLHKNKTKLAEIAIAEMNKTLTNQLVKLKNVHHNMVMILVL